MSVIIKNAKFGPPKPVIDSSLVQWFDPGNKNSTNRINLLSQSEVLTDTTVWSTFHASVIGNATTDYLGNATADKLVSSADTNFHAISQLITTSDNTVYTVMTEVKAAGYNYAGLGNTLNNTNYTECRLYINLTTGAVISTLNLITYSVTDIGNGWWRALYTFNSNEGQTILGNSPSRINIVSSPDGVNFNFLGDGTSGIYIARVHMNKGADYLGYENTTTFPLIKSLVGTNSVQLRQATQIDYNNGGAFKNSTQTPALASLTNTLTLSEWTYSVWVKTSKFSPGNGINQGGLYSNLVCKNTGSYPRCQLQLGIAQSYIVKSLFIDSFNNIWCSGNFNEFRSSRADLLIKILNNGTLDSSTTYLNNITANANNSNNALNIPRVRLDSLGRLYYCGLNIGNLIRLTPTFTQDPTFTLTTVNIGYTNDFIIDEVNNKIYLIGWFTIPTKGVAKLNIDGTLDSSFNAVGSGFNGFSGTWYMDINSTKTKIYIGGNHTVYNGITNNYITAINTSDGSIDSSFISGTGFNAPVNYVVVDSNDKIYVCGNFTSYNGTACNKIVRLNPDGTIDSGFDIGTGFNNNVYSILLSGGNVYMCGNFTSYKGISTNWLVKTDTFGTKDLVFNIGTGFSGPSATNTLYTLAIDGNNKLVVGGSFSQFNGIYTNNIIRLDSVTGTVDNYFGSGSGVAYSSSNGITDGQYRYNLNLYFNNIANNGLTTFTFYFTTIVNGINLTGRMSWANFITFWGSYRQITMTLNSSKILTVYVDGVNQGTLDVSSADPKLVMDQIGISNGIYKTGEMVYNRVLTTSEVIQNYNAVKNRYL